MVGVTDRAGTREAAPPPFDVDQVQFEATSAHPRHSAVRDVAQMLRDEYEAIHGPLPAGWLQIESVGTQSLASSGSVSADTARLDDRDKRLRALYRQVHALPAEFGRSALCLSGGGVRSAAFSLGVLQALARARVLERFHYLSTVSGGGYIGAWLTAWIHWHSSKSGPSGAVGCRTSSALGEVSEQLASRDGSRPLGGDHPPEPEQVAHLRRFTNYLSPHTGAFSLDTWTLAAVYLRNLFLNWTVVVPLLGAALIVPRLGVEGLIAAAALIVPRLGVEGLMAAVSFARDRPRLAAVLIPTGLAILPWLALIVLTLVRRRFADVGTAERYSRWEAKCVRFGASGAALAALVMYGPGLLREIPTLLGGVGASSISTFLLKKLGDRGSPPGAEVKRSARLVRAATTGAALLTITLILIALSSAVHALVDWISLPLMASLSLSPDTAKLGGSAILFITALVISALAAMVVDINDFSLHALYRNRLVRAFLRASRGADAPQSDTAFDPKDDLPLVRLWPQTPVSGNPLDRPHLFHVINATLNDLGGTRPEWNERKGVSFTFSPLHYGAHIPGRYGEAKTSGEDGYRLLTCIGANADSLRLGTAMSISGAAASPNMGYHSSPAVTFLMALFNVRLGWWMRPPWKEGEASTTLRRLLRTPLLVWRAWWAEAFGGTRFNSAVVNVSDGGHFDNLGLYEMVRRRCRSIVVVDAGQDGGHTFESLAEAVRKIRIDFGVPITITELDLSDGSSRLTARHLRLGRPAPSPLLQDAAPPVHAYYGTIRYSAVDHYVESRGGEPPAPVPDGELVYIKPLVSGDEPVDIQSYRRLHRAFPHETTVDQWFSESQFESYRALGEHSVQHLLDYYQASKGQPRAAQRSAVRMGPAPLPPQEFCHRVAESLALMRRHKQFSSHAGGVVYRKLKGRLEFLFVKSIDHLNRILPKGYIEPWEDAATTARREVREEAGYTLAPAHSLGVSSYKTETRTVTTTYFLMEEATEKREEKPFEDYRDPRWFTIDEARAADLPVDLSVPGDIIEVLERARDLTESHAGGVVYRRGRHKWWSVFSSGRRHDGQIEFLLVRSKDRMSRVLPKGHIKPNEDSATAAAREVKEESGYSLKPRRSLGVFAFETAAGTVTTKYFLMEEATWASAWELDEPTRDPRWFTIAAARAADLPVPEGVIAVLDHALRAIDSDPQLSTLT